jgi:hypothetical protein
MNENGSPVSNQKASKMLAIHFQRLIDMRRMLIGRLQYSPGNNRPVSGDLAHLSL